MNFCIYFSKILRLSPINQNLSCEKAIKRHYKRSEDFCKQAFKPYKFNQNPQDKAIYRKP